MPFAAQDARQRLVSLDVLRGLAVAGMILVVSPGSWEQHYAQLEHAEWHDWTLADLIFPAFLVAVGMAITLSLGGRIARGDARVALAGQVLRRSVLLLVIGLVLNGFPQYDFAHLRIPGILQRIALCFAGASFLLLALWRDGNVRVLIARLVAAAIAILLFYWALLAFVPVPGFGAGHLDSLANLPAYLDRRIFGVAHMWAYGTTGSQGVTYDPEGLLSTLPAAATVMIGVICGFWLRLASPPRVLSVLVAAGAILLAVGLALDPLIPIIKKIWTDSFVLFSGGAAVLAFAALYALCDLKGWTGWAFPLRVLGANAILAFALSQAIGPLSDLAIFHGPDSTIREAGFGLIQRMVPDGNLASLLFAAANLVVIFLLLWPLHHRRIFLRV